MLGEYDNNRGDMPKRPTVYSPYSFSNTFSTVDPSRMSFSFWNRMLKVTITPMIGKNDAGVPTFDKDNAISAYFTHTKALIMAREIRKFLADPATYNSSGIISNETLVTISNGEEFNQPGIYLVVRKIDKETGNSLSSYAYHFNTELYNSVRNYKAADMSFITEFDEYANIEIEQLLTLLDTYVESMTYAQAYSTIDAVDYNYNQMMNCLNEICKGLGIEMKSGKDRKPYNNNSIFNKKGTTTGYTAGGKTVQHVSPEEVEEDLFG